MTLLLMLEFNLQAPVFLNDLNLFETACFPLYHFHLLLQQRYLPLQMLVFSKGSLQGSCLVLLLNRDCPQKLLQLLNS